MKHLRQLLPYLDSCVYLNYAAGAPVFNPSLDKMNSLINQIQEPLQFHFEEWSQLLAKARKTVAELICAEPLEIAFVTGTSHGLSLIANSIFWNSQDHILYPADEFPSNTLVWENLNHKGVIAEAVPVLKELSFYDQLTQMNMKNVRLVALSAISYKDGRYHEIEKIVKFCHQHNTLVVVDAIQAAGAMPIDVLSWGCDFLVSGGQKWLFGPIGTGFVYIKKELIEKLFVSQIGWASVEDRFAKEKKFVSGAARFEPGYCHLPAIVGLSTSIEIMKKAGWETIFERIQTLTKVIKEKLADFVVTPSPHAGIITLKTPKAAQIQKQLLQQNVIVTQRDDLLRLGLHATVLEQELELFIKIFSQNV